MYGGDDGARTRDLCRDSNDLQARGERLKPPKSYKTSLFVDRIVDRLFDLAALGNDRHL